MKMIELHRNGETYSIRPSTIISVIDKGDRCVIYTVGGKFYFEADEAYEDIVNIISAIGE